MNNGGAQILGDLCRLYGNIRRQRAASTHQEEQPVSNSHERENSNSNASLAGGGRLPSTVNVQRLRRGQLSRCLEKLDSIVEPNGEGSMLDNTIVLFGSGMGYGGTHSNRNLPIMVAGGGFSHRGHVDARGTDGQNMPLCDLFVTLMQRFGIERDKFNRSTGAFELRYS